MVFVIGLVGFIIYARHNHLVPFDKIPVKKAREEAVISSLIEDDFYHFEAEVPNTIRLGGGNSIIVYDTTAGKVISHNQLINAKTDFNHFFEGIEKHKSEKELDSFNIALVDFSPNEPYFNLLKTNVSRGFYLGIYRELIENIQSWQKKYKSVIVLSKILPREDGSADLLIMLHTYSKRRNNSPEKQLKAEVAFLIPCRSTTQHLLDFIIAKDFKGTADVKHFLDMFHYSYPDIKTVRKYWKIDPKRFELRNLKWNFD